MAQALEFSRFGYDLSQEDQLILQSLERGKLSIQQVMALVDVEQSKALLSITKLIAAGHLKLEVIAYLWGVEFLLQTTREITPHQPGKY